MKRQNFLKALAGLGFVGAMPKALKAEKEEFVITSSDGRTAWDFEGNEVWQEKLRDTHITKYDGDSITYWSGERWIPYRP